MLTFLKRRFQNQKGAVDKILVTLLLIIIGISTLIALSQWKENQDITQKDTTTPKTQYNN